MIMAEQLRMHSRRAILTAGVVGATAVAAHAVGALGTALAADGDAILLGHVDNSSSAPTDINSHAAAYGFGVDNSRSDGRAIWGASSGEGGIGVYGTATGGASSGGTGTGVWGESDQGPGVFGTSASDTYAGVYASTSNAKGIALYASAGNKDAVGVYAYTPGGGTAVFAWSAYGRGLSVEGRASFSTSGFINVAAGKSSVTVKNDQFRTAAWAVATLRKHVSGVYVTAAVPAKGKLTIYLNKAVSSTTLSRTSSSTDRMSSARGAWAMTGMPRLRLAIGLASLLAACGPAGSSAVLTAVTAPAVIVSPNASPNVGPSASASASLGGGQLVITTCPPSAIANDVCLDGSGTLPSPDVAIGADVWAILGVKNIGQSLSSPMTLLLRTVQAPPFSAAFATQACDACQSVAVGDGVGYEWPALIPGATQVLSIDLRALGPPGNYAWSFALYPRSLAQLGSGPIAPTTAVYTGTVATLVTPR